MENAKQYCRYCGFLVTGNGIWCIAKNKEVAESTAKRTNKCPHFAFCPTDAFFENEKEYKPRKEYKLREKRMNQCDGQLSFISTEKENEA